MKAVPGFSMCENDKYFALIDGDGFIETDELDKMGLPWERNEGADGPVLAGKSWSVTISLPGRGWDKDEAIQEQ